MAHKSYDCLKLRYFHLERKGEKREKHMQKQIFFKTYTFKKEHNFLYLLSETELLNSSWRKQASVNEISNVSTLFYDLNGASHDHVLYLLLIYFVHLKAGQETEEIRYREVRERERERQETT